MSNLPDISHLRGMSDPFFFSFNVLKEGRMVCHGVIFSSFEVADDNKTIKICTLGDDPRMKHFVEFVVNNYGKIAEKNVLKAIKKQNPKIDSAVDEFDEARRNLRELRKQLNADNNATT